MKTRGRLIASILVTVAIVTALLLTTAPMNIQAQDGDYTYTAGTGTGVTVYSDSDTTTVTIGDIPAKAQAAGTNSYRPVTVDVYTTDTDNLTIQISYDDSEFNDESDIVPEYFNNETGEWVECSDYEINTTANYINVTVTTETTPSVPLEGTAFSLVSYNLSVSPDTVIYNSEAVELTGTLTEGGDLLKTPVNYSVYTPEGQQVGYGTTNNGEFTHTQDFIYNDSLNTPYEANYTVYVNTSGEPTQTNWEAKFVIQQELDFVWNEEDEQPFVYDSSQGFSGKLVDAKGDVIEDYNVTLKRDGKTVEYDNFQDGYFGFTTIINDHAEWELGVTDNTSYLYEYFDVETEPKDNLDIELDTDNTVAGIAEGAYNITVTNISNDKYGIINVTGIQWKEAPDANNITGGELLANGTDSATGDATWLLFNDSNNNGLLNFTAAPNSTGDIVIDARYEDPEIETPSTWNTSSEYYDRTGTLDPATTITAPQDVNMMYNKTLDLSGQNEVTENQTIEVLPYNTTQDRIRLDNNRFGTQKAEFFSSDSAYFSPYVFQTELRWSNGTMIEPGENGVQEVTIEGADSFNWTMGTDLTYNYTEIQQMSSWSSGSSGDLILYNQTTGDYYFSFVPSEDDDYVTAEIKVNNSGEIVTKTIKKEVDGLTADISVNDESVDSVTWSTEGEITAQITKEGEYINNGFVYIKAMNKSSGQWDIFNVTDARTDLVNEGMYSFDLDNAIWDDIDANEDMWFIGYWYEDADEDDQFDVTEVSLAVYENFEIEPKDVYDIEVSPDTLTAGVQEKNLTITVTNDTGQPVTDVIANHTVTVNGEQYSVGDINASAGEYVIQPTNGFVFNETGTYDVNVTRDDQTKTGTGTFDVELPVVEFEVESFNPENKSMSEVFGEDFLLTAGVNRTYNITATVYEYDGETILNGTADYDAEIMLGYVNETGFQNVTQLMTLDENGSHEFEFTPSMAKDFVWKVGEFTVPEYDNDSRALVEEPPVMAEQPDTKVLDRAGGEIPDMSLPLGYETELLIVASPADEDDYLFDSFEVKAEGSIAETNATAKTETGEDPTTGEEAQVARLTITPTGTGIDAIQITASEKFPEPLAELNVTDTVNKLDITLTPSTDIRPGDTIQAEITFDEEPIDLARLTVSGQGISTRTLETNDQGIATFSIDQAGTFTLDARRAGYGPAERQFTVQGKPEVTEEITIVGPTDLTVGDTATYLVKANGQALTDATVELGDQTYTTDDTGRVEITYEEAGNFLLTATKTQDETEDEVITYISDTISVEVTKETVTKDLTIQLPEEDLNIDNELTFTVVDEDGEAVEDATVTAGDQTATTDSEGVVTFTFEEAGLKTIKATKGQEETDAQITTYTSDTKNIEIQETPGFIAITAITGLLVAALLALRRKQTN